MRLRSKGWMDKTYESGSVALLVIALLLSPMVASAQEVASTAPEPAGVPAHSSTRVDVLLGVGYLSSGAAHGMALSAGTRVELGRYGALGFDLGYGVVASADEAQDRWWLIPTAAFVLPIDSVRLELGGGVGFGTSSGYRDFDAFASDPFMPDWALQLVPVIRAHLGASLALDPNVTGFVRLEFATLLLEGNDIGLRDNNPAPVLMDTIWFGLVVGTSFRAL